ncbi:DUF3761 domain-containing protein [Dyella jiangningensis]|uniref:DUF3761 domain-containing protein n=1 Tax=Dyella jiangningensis TaxID=1379159 RepID=UPI00240EE718|nr:DUF3761 domain-containing protein [Dyella jiangningensis]MDG2537589.1 DUF3761 domain-containing protein [Dyella jiangningensis]
MKSYGLIAVLLAGLLAGPAVYAQQASAPAGSTGQCKDGSYTDHATKKGACSGHKGVKEWYDTAAATPAAAAPAAAPAASPAPSTPTKTAAPSKSAHEPAATAAPGGGPGMVWVNSSSKVYHCPSDKWYGKTKSGSYMSEADAKAKGYHADHNKACTP